MTALYAIADADTLRSWGVPLREFAEGILAAGPGVGFVQWRCKGGSAAEVLEGAAVLRQVLTRPAWRLILNDWAELVEQAGFDGVHVGQEDVRVEDARGVVGPQAIVGLSTHTEAQVRAAELSSADYVAVGPVFLTGTKGDAAPVIGLDGVRAARGLTAKPLVAIGGITTLNAPEVLDAGADMVAVIGALHAGGHGVERNTQDLLRALGHRRR